MTARLTVDTPKSFRFRTTLLSHGWLELEPFRHDDAYTQVRRIERLSDGQVVELTFSAGKDEALDVAVAGIQGVLTETHRRDVETMTRRIFNLDVDLGPFYDALESEARYRWVGKYGGGRLLRAPTVWEDLAKTLLTTNTTWNMTRQMVRRLNEMGEAGETGFSFPSPERIAAAPLEEFVGQVRAGYRGAYLHELARSIAEGRVDVERWTATDLPADDLYRQLRSLKGFGPYAAGASLKLLGRFDYLAIDSAARSMFVRTFGDGRAVADADIRAHYERFGKWKGLVIWMDLMHDWFSEHHSDQDHVPRGS